MRIIVCVKQVLDPKTVKISRSREDFDLRDAARILNPPDKYALEAALRLREATGGEVIALSAGGPDAEDVVHEAIAIGADRGVLVAGPELAAAASGAVVTRVLAAAVGRLAPVDLVLTGAAGLTDGTGSLAPRLAAALEWPVLLDAVQLSAGADGPAALVADANAAHSAPLATPAVVAVTPGAERPRYPHPARIANAWNEGTVETWAVADLGLTDLASDTEAGGLILGPERVRGQMIGGSTADAAKAVANLLKAQRVGERRA